MLVSLPFASAILGSPPATGLPVAPTMRWQAASSGVAVGGTVSSIPDVTGNGYTGTVAGSPTIVSSYNSHPAFHTDGTASALLGSAAAAALFNSTAVNPNGWSLAIVFIPDTPGVGTNLFGVNASTKSYMLARTTVSATTFQLSSLCESTSSTYWQTSAATAAASTTAPNVVIDTGVPSSTATKMYTYLNGVKATMSGTAPVLTSFDQLHFGLSYANNAPNTSPSFYAGKYFDIVVWNTALTDAQAAQATTYLQSLYS